ncbi:mCG148157 [Mus musculus]|nr:mCG148157 [Mus musculus]
MAPHINSLIVRCKHRHPVCLFAGLYSLLRSLWVILAQRHWLPSQIWRLLSIPHVFLDQLFPPMISSRSFLNSYLNITVFFFYIVSAGTFPRSTGYRRFQISSRRYE